MRNEPPRFAVLTGGGVAVGATVGTAVGVEVGGNAVGVAVGAGRVGAMAVDVAAGGVTGVDIWVAGTDVTDGRATSSLLHATANAAMATTPIVAIFTITGLNKFLGPPVVISPVLPGTSPAGAP